MLAFLTLACDGMHDRRDGYEPLRSPPRFSPGGAAVDEMERAEEVQPPELRRLEAMEQIYDAYSATGSMSPWSSAAMEVWRFGGLICRVTPR